MKIDLTSSVVLWEEEWIVAKFRRILSDEEREVLQLSPGRHSSSV